MQQLVCPSCGKAFNTDEAGYAEITVMLDGGHTIHDVERIKGAAGAAHVVIETTTSTIYVPEQNVVAIETP